MVSNLPAAVGQAPAEKRAVAYEVLLHGRAFVLLSAFNETLFYTLLVCVDMEAAARTCLLGVRR